jgi:uncharacterized protein with HEPN domain
MPPETAKLLQDMVSAAGRVERFTAGKSYDDYANDDLLRSAVERQFEIIGEAMTRLMKHDRSVAERLTDYRKIAGFRNALVHGYDAIDDLISWGVVTQKLHVLRSELERLLTE